MQGSFYVNFQWNMLEFEHREINIHKILEATNLHDNIINRPCTGNQ